MMARLEIDERAFSDPRLKTIARNLGISRCAAMGYLVVLWHDSQECLKSHATKEEIGSWLELSPSEIDLFTNMLQASNYIVLDGENSYRIRGNQRRLTKVKMNRTRARKAATARWDSKYIPNENNNQQDMLGGMHKHKRQASVKHCQDKEIKRGRDKERNKSPSENFTPSMAQNESLRQPIPDPIAEVKKMPGVEVIDVEVSGNRSQGGKNGARKLATGLGNTEIGGKPFEAVQLFKNAFQRKFPSLEPKVLGPDWSAAKQLVKCLGNIETIREYIDGYFTLDDQFLVREFYKLRYLPGKLSQVEFKLKSGVTVTGTIARQVEQVSHNRMVGEMYLKSREDDNKTEVAVGSADW